MKRALLGLIPLLLFGAWLRHGSVAGSIGVSLTGITLSDTNIPGSTNAGVFVGYINVTTSSGPFTGTVAVDDTTHFSVGGCPSACGLWTAATMSNSHGYPIHLTASQTGTADLGPLSYTINANAGTVDSTHPTFTQYVKFQGDATGYGPKGCVYGNLAGTTAHWKINPPVFMAGFFEPQDFTTFGILSAYGNQATGGRGGGLLAYGTSTAGQGYGTEPLSLFEWTDYAPSQGYVGVQTAPMPYTRPRYGNAASYLTGQWQYTAIIYYSLSSVQSFLDGVYSSTPSTQMY